MSSRQDQRESIAAALKTLGSRPFVDASLQLFSTLGYTSERRMPVATPREFCEQLDPHNRLTDRERETLDQVKSLHFLFQISDAELSVHTDMFEDVHEVQATKIESYLFFAVELAAGKYTRTALSALVRAVNKPLPMPALVLFRHADTASLGIIHRRLNKRDQARDVLEKVTLIKDVDFADPIRAHLEILNDFVLANLDADFGVSNFVGLHEAWQRRLGSYALSSDFYREIADWYFWAHHLVEDGSIKLPPHCDTEQEKSLFLIRLLTRVIFCWFLVEKRLIPPDLFREHRLKSLLKAFNPSQDPRRPDGAFSYYRAVLQNLFFGTLNMPPDQRAFLANESTGGRRFKKHRDTNLWRYESEFRDPADWRKLSGRIPFLNGGLFDCLDDRGGTQENYSILDGFSDAPGLGCFLSNDLFFGAERTVDLSSDYGEAAKRTARSKKAKVRGLIEILARYKFTIEENTPLEEEIALDPELLGKVFENLLASFNEDTQTTARKALGAFYTPREIVSYMVDEALKSYLGGQVPRCKGALEDLFSNKATLRDIRPDTREALILAISHVKVLDPACGSGAFPMGALQRLVDLLQKLDPNNEHWKRCRLEEVERHRQVLKEAQASEEELEACEARIADIEKSFDTRFHDLDFARKLYLIENSIYGVDIQPVATQIAKLRFFISLIVDQKIDIQSNNLGVRPLPNLETRLVAADTLTPIDKEEIDLFSSDVDKLRGDLSRIRHEHFNARSPEAKKKWRNADAAKRRAIAVLLEDSHSLSHVNARKLSAWDPYDQNSFAPFFDSEWMFGFAAGDGRDQHAEGRAFCELTRAAEEHEQSAFQNRSGFDIVIGNPPYGIRYSALVKAQLAQLYPQASKLPDSYAFFILRGLRLLRNGGVLSYIAPNTFCDLENGEQFRRHLLSSTKVQSIWQSGWVFSAAVVDTLVLVLENVRPMPEHETLVITENGRQRRIQRQFLDSPLAKIDFRSSLSVLALRDQIRNSTAPLSSQFYVKAGVKMYECGKGDPPQSQEVVNSKPFSGLKDSSAGWRTLYRGSDIAPFLLSDSGERVNYGPWLAAPRTPDLFEPPKILMRRTDDRLRSCLDLSNSICVNSCHVIKLIAPGEDALVRYKATLAVLNSRVCQWMFSADNPQMVGKTFAEIKVVYVKRLPMPKATEAQERLLSTVVDLLLMLKRYFVEPLATPKQRDPLMLAYWERTLNGLVYELYFPEEVHRAGIRCFELVAELQLATNRDIADSNCLNSIRAKFEALYAGTNPMRIALDKLQTLDTVRMIESSA